MLFTCCYSLLTVFLPFYYTQIFVYLVNMQVTSVVLYIAQDNHRTRYRLLLIKACEKLAIESGSY